MSYILSPQTRRFHVAINEQNHSARDVKRAKQALELYRRLGRPTQPVFFKIFDENLIKDCPVTWADAKIAFHVYGKDPTGLMGKTKRHKPPPVLPLAYISVPDHVLALHREVAIAVDIFFINGIKFFRSISNNIKLRHFEIISNVAAPTLAKCTITIINLYQYRGFRVVEVQGNGQFKYIEENISPVHLYISATGEHIPQVERSIQTIEGDCRTLYRGLSYSF